MRRSAQQEAITLLTKGLELLKTLSDTPKRMQQELLLQIALSDALALVKGYTVPEVEYTLTQARTLCQRLGETRKFFSVLLRLWLLYFNRGELLTLCELAEQLMHLAQNTHNQYVLSLAHWP